MKSIPHLFCALVFYISFHLPAQAQISLTEFQVVSAVFQAEFAEDMTARNATLTINRPPSPQAPNFWWNLDQVHASYSGYKDDDFHEHNLFLFGGYARMKGMTVDGVAMTLCHELGHGIGGSPFKDKGDDSEVSTEGQSDYFAARECIKRVFRRLPETQPVLAPSSYTSQLCASRFKTEEDLYLCHRGFQVLEVERIFLRTQLRQEETDVSYETPDPAIVTEMDLSPTFYPSAQCRLDTMVAGILEEERPRCWWAPSKN